MSEKTAVQGPLVEYATQIGWDHVSPAAALSRRGGEGGRFFADVLEGQLLRLNPGTVNPARAAAIVRQLTLLPATIEGNRDCLRWLRGEESVFVEEQKQTRNVRLIDFESPEKNVFHVTDEWWQKGVAHRNRADVVLLVNGVPVAVAETKGATLANAMEKGVQQVRRYHDETPELFVASQVFEVTQALDFFYGVTWNTTRRGLLNWKDEQPGNFERKVKDFFDQRRFLDVLRNQIAFITKDDGLSKIILKQHQTRAVEKVLGRVAEPFKRRGLVWHTQGSGKTLTMLSIAARLLREGMDGGERPTVLLVADRTELEDNLSKDIDGYGIKGHVIARSKADLRDILARDQRGLVVSMVHKFDDMPAKVNERSSIVVLVDEAHRTTGGDLGNYLLAAVPNATFIGFTGTPIDKIQHGRGTFKTFGVDDDRGYLDKYSIAEAIEDGTTVALNYALAPTNLLVDKATLEREFLKLAEAQGISDPEELNAILDRAVELKELMKSPTRVDQIAAYVAEHYRTNVKPMGFKAFLVAVDREACALYKAAIDKYLPAEWTAVVYSAGQNDSATLAKYHLDAQEEKQLRKRFVKRDELPKILIVTEKLLTGFDAPILYAMYLDKPMRDHVLLQAIARVNRPYEDEKGQAKPYGFVLDFVGIFDDLKAALSFDSDVVASVIQNIDVLKRLFEQMMRAQAAPYLILPKDFTDKDKDRAIQKFADAKDRDAFYRFFKQVQGVYEILSPDAILRPFIDDYRRLAELYAVLKNAYTASVYADADVTNKTRELLRAQTVAGKLEPPGAIHQLGVAELEALKRGDESPTVKVLNLRKLLAQAASEAGDTKPYLIPIGERAAKAAEAYENRQVSTQEALDLFTQLAHDAVNAGAEIGRLGIDANTYAILVAVRPIAGGVSVEQATGIDGLFAKYPDAGWNEKERNLLRMELYKALRPIVGAGKMVDATNTILNLTRV